MFNIPSSTGILLVNFGGPRNLDEIYPFLQSLLTDREVIRSSIPDPFYNLLFSFIAKKRSKKVRGEYEYMGGCSPIYGDTEAVALQVKSLLENPPLLTFHRYIPETHASFIESIKNWPYEEIRVFPLFPQFSYATTGSAARWFKENLPRQVLNRMRWIKSYPTHPGFIKAHQNHLKRFMADKGLKEEETAFLYSAHGLPKLFVESGDIYQSECEASVREIMKGFPDVIGKLSYQSKFGRGEWLRPYTIDVSTEVLKWNQDRKHVIFVPISFTSDHIETLCEIENDYMTAVRKAGIQAWRIPALTLNEDWMDAIAEIISEEPFCTNDMLVRHRCV